METNVLKLLGWPIRTKQEKRSMEEHCALDGPGQLDPALTADVADALLLALLLSVGGGRLSNAQKKNSQ